MIEKGKTKEQLIAELAELRRQLTALRATVAQPVQDTALQTDCDLCEPTGKMPALSQAYMTKIFNASPTPMVICTLEEGCFFDVNDSFLRNTGFLRKQVIGRTSRELNFWANPQDEDKVRQHLYHHGRIENMEMCFRTRSGEIREELLSAEVFEFNGKNFLIATITDISKLKKLEREMAFLDRLHLVGEMAAGLGHEIRNPMTTIRGFLQLIAKREEIIKYRGQFDLMIGELDRANSIITEFLSLARDKVVDFERQSINGIVQGLIPLIKADAVKSGKIVHTQLGYTPDVALNEKEIRQLVLNLARNGLEAMQGSGILTIKTYSDRMEVVLSVHDQGDGIAPSIREKIGTPFFTTKDYGTGIGLAVCYSIAARHNARIDIDTGPWGTTFYVRFALHNDKKSAGV